MVKAIDTFLITSHPIKIGKRILRPYQIGELDEDSNIKRIYIGQQKLVKYTTYYYYAYFNKSKKWTLCTTIEKELLFYGIYDQRKKIIDELFYIFHTDKLLKNIPVDPINYSEIIFGLTDTKKSTDPTLYRALVKEYGLEDTFTE
jgi:hypothetical protein